MELAEPAANGWVLETTNRPLIVSLVSLLFDLCIASYVDKLDGYDTALGVIGLRVTV